MMTTYKHF